MESRYIEKPFQSMSEWERVYSATTFSNKLITYITTLKKISTESFTIYMRKQDNSRFILESNVPQK